VIVTYVQTLLRKTNQYEMYVIFGLTKYATLWFGIEDYHLVVYGEVGSIPEELLLGQGRVFSI
jgi:hypothetical protein